MKKKRSKGWLGTLDRTPFDETFDDLENINDEVFGDGACLKHLNDDSPIFWAA